MWRHDLIRACLYGALFLASATSAVAETPREQAHRLVEDGVTLIAQKGIAAACTEFETSDSEFRHADTYVFVVSMRELWVCYPPNSQLEGQSPVGIIDDTGGDLIKDQVKIAQSSAGEGWIGYTWPNPTTNLLQAKESFVKRVPNTELIVISGYYK